MYVEVLLLVYVGPSHIRPIALFYFYGDSLGGVAGKIQVRTKQVPITEPVWRIVYLLRECTSAAALQSSVTERPRGCAFTLFVEIVKQEVLVPSSGFHPKILTNRRSSALRLDQNS